MVTVTEFLLARIAEDEAIARDVVAAAAGVLVYGDFTDDPPWVLTGTRRGSMAMLITTARVLAECEAKRQIVEDLADVDGMGSFLDGWWSAHHAVMQVLALPYADHPEFDEAWRP